MNGKAFLITRTVSTKIATYAVGLLVPPMPDRTGEGSTDDTRRWMGLLLALGIGRTLPGSAAWDACWNYHALCHVAVVPGKSEALRDTGAKTFY